MPAITRVYTISRAAMILGVSEDLLDRLADTMEPEDGVLWIDDDTEHGCRGFTEFGLDSAREQLDDPSIVKFLLDQA